MRGAMFRIVCALLLASCVAPTAAADIGRAESPVKLASRIETRATGTSFAALEHFGGQAATRTDREGLRRLHHVVSVMRSQSEFELATRFNAMLAASAARQRDARYIATARLNAIALRYDEGDAAALAELQRARAAQPDWFGNALAETLWARVLVDERKTGAALNLLSQAERPIPRGNDPDAKAAKSAIWEMIGLSLMGLNDLEGAASAFQRSQFEFADPAHPRPDFDALYNLGRIAIDLGDEDTARSLTNAHHRLTGRADLSHLAAWDANLCGLFAETFEGPREVLGCFSAIDAKLTGAEFLQRSILPMRAIAQARLGRLADARADLARLQRYARSPGASAVAGGRIPEVQAELKLAEGDAAGAYQLVRRFERDQRFRRAGEVYSGVRQVTGSLQTQLEVARHDTAITADAVRAQRWVIVLGVFLFLVLGVLVVMQRRGARKLRAAQNHAEAANAAKSAFLATMSHEIRTPLNGVLGMAQAMSSEKLSPRQQERLGVIRQSGEALLAILNDVLDLSKIEAGKLELEVVEFDLGELARGAYSAFTAIANKKGVSFALDIQAAKGRYRGDPSRLRQVLYNLISNALKFTEQGEIRVTASYADGRLSLSVKDTGLGIARENLPKLFGKFDQLDSSTTRRFGGTGLGLAICRELALLMEGEMSVESELGLGSRFTLCVPLERVGDETERAAEAAAEEETAPIELRVLAAEDNTVNQLVLKTLLHQLGVDPHIVEDGKAALAAWEAAEWDIILMDVQMPVMDGLTAATLIRQREAATGRRRTPIIALTANAMSHQVQQYLAVGMDGHVAKPIEVSALYRALSQGLPDDAAGEATEDAAERRAS